MCPLACKFWCSHGGDYEECRLLWYKKNLFVPHRRRITSPLQKTARQYYVRFEILTAVTMKNSVFCDEMLYTSCKNRRFGGNFRLHHEAWKDHWARKNVWSNQQLVYTCLLLVNVYVVPSSLILSTLMRGSISSSETLVLTRVTNCHIPGDGIFQIVKLLICQFI
jgi:hypothetical protein